MKLHEALLGCSTGQLRRVAEAWGVPAELGTLRHEFAEALTPRIVVEVADEGFWTGLDGDTHRVMEMLIQAHGRHEADLLVRRLATADTAGPDEAARRIEQRVGRLIELGLVFRLFEAEHGLRRTVLLLPDEVVEALRPRVQDTVQARMP